MKVYVSSTYEDLKAHRRAVYAQLRKLRLDALAMEDYVAGERRPLARCLGDVETADVYVGIFAWRYGHVPKADNPERRSITELEYRKAIDLNKEVLIFVLHEDAPWRVSLMDWHPGAGEDERRIWLLREELCERHSVGFFSSPGELASEVSAALSAVLRRSGAAGPAEAVAGYIRQLVETGHFELDETGSLFLRIDNDKVRVSPALGAGGEVAFDVLLEQERPEVESALEAIASETSIQLRSQVIGRADVPAVAPAEIPPQTPLGPGSSVSHARGLAGTLTCFVRFEPPGAGRELLGFVGSGHILALANAARIGDEILSPGHPVAPLSEQTVVGTLEDYTELRPHEEADPTAVNTLDLALVRLRDESIGSVGNLIPDPRGRQQRIRVERVVAGGSLFGLIGQRVFNVGRRGLTEGVLEFTNVKRYAMRMGSLAGDVCFWDDLFAVVSGGPESFYTAGDSGALVVTEDGAALGMVVGGNKEYAFCMPLSSGLERLGCRLE